MSAKKKYIIAAPDRSGQTAIDHPPEQDNRRRRGGQKSEAVGLDARGKKKYVIGSPEAAESAGYPKPALGSAVRPNAPSALGTSKPDKAGFKTGRKAKRVLRWVAWISIVTFLAIATYGFALLWRFDSSMRRESLETSVALAPGGVTTMNILVTGSDTRQGSNIFIPGDPRPGLADVIMVVQVRFDKVQLLSIPRDTRVVLPQGGEQKINASLALGGPPLLIRAVSELTGLRIHRYVALDFAGFVSLTDSLGGVELCLDNAERDHFSGLSLPAGCQVVGGEQALAYVRSRHTEIERGGRWIPDTGGDFSRMQRQQRYFDALAKKLKSPYVMATKGWSISTTLGKALSSDRGFGYYTETRLALAMALSNPEHFLLPGNPVDKSGVSYVEIDKDKARSVLERFRS